MTTTDHANPAASPPEGFPRVLADGTVGRTQMEVVDSLITLGLPSIHGESPRHGVSSMLYIYVDNVGAHDQQAKTAGATIITEPADQPWGDRPYQVADPEGHQWTFAQHVGPAAPCDHNG